MTDFSAQYLYNATYIEGESVGINVNNNNFTNSIMGDASSIMTNSLANVIIYLSDGPVINSSYFINTTLILANGPNIGVNALTGTIQFSFAAGPNIGVNALTGTIQFSFAAGPIVVSTAINPNIILSSSNGISGTFVFPATGEDIIYYKLRGYYNTGSVYEVYVSTDPSASAPSGHSLTNIVIVDAWIS